MKPILSFAFNMDTACMELNEKRLDKVVSLC